MSVLPETDTRISDAAAEQLLHDLVAIASPSHHERAAVEMLTQWMRDNGYDSAFIDAADTVSRRSVRPCCCVPLPQLRQSQQDAHHPAIWHVIQQQQMYTANP